MQIALKFVAGLTVAALTTFAGHAHAGLFDAVLGSKPEAAQASAQTLRASFNEVLPDGANLREMLVLSDTVHDVIPYGKTISWVVPKQDGGGLLVSRANGDALAALASTCKTQWLVKTYKQDPMSNQISYAWTALAADDSPSLIFKHSERNPRTGERDLLLGAQCKDSFEITQVFLVGGVNQLVQSFLVKHLSEQPLVWKSPRTVLPKADMDLVDGVLDVKAIANGGYPLSSEVAAWSNALCDLRGGKLLFLVNAPDRDGRYPATDAPERMAARDIGTKYTGNAPINEFFFECSTANNRSFLIKGQERDLKLQLVVQNNRTLASIFGELRLRPW
nr:hypothetical protein [uncultured Roseateles sp.]